MPRARADRALPPPGKLLQQNLADGILCLTLQGPDEIPRLSHALLRELHDVFDQIAAPASSLPRVAANTTPAYSGLHAMVITGTEKALAAGADLAEVSALTPVEALQFSALGQDLMRKIERCAMPIVAAIRGWCLGGGFDLALACHLRVAARDALFGHPGGSLGIVTGWGGTARLPRIVGRARAMELLVTGRSLTADEAFAARLVNRLVPPENVLPTAVEFARTAAGRAQERK